MSDFPKNAADKARQGTEVVRANPLPIFAGVLALLVTIRLILRRRMKRWR